MVKEVVDQLLELGASAVEKQRWKRFERFVLMVKYTQVADFGLNMAKGALIGHVNGLFIL